MLNKFRRSIRKYPILSIELVLIILGFSLVYLTKHTAGNIVLTSAALIGVVYGINKSLDILRHGFYGIQLLQLTGIVCALFLRQPQTAALLALVIVVEQPFFGKNKQSLFRMKHAPLVKSLDVASLPFTVLLFLIGGAIWTVTRDSSRFLEVIAVGSTAPLLIAAPLVIKNRMSAVTSDTVKIASARIFEILSDAQTIILRKSGVLTEKDVELSKIYTFGKNTKSHVIQVAAALAHNSPHPTTRAIIDYVEGRHKIDSAKHANTVVGEGIIGRKKGTELLIGRFDFLESRGITMPSKPIDDTSVLVYVAQNGVSIGALSFTDKPQAKLRHYATQLKKLGFTTVELVSGASHASTAAIAKTAGISTYQGDMTVSDVITRVQSHADRPVVYVGNDEQDEAVLSQAAVSISTDPNAVSASIEMSDYSFEKLVDLIAASKKSFKIARWLALATLAVNLIFVMLAAAGMLTAFYAALVNLGITLLVLLLTTGLKASRPRQEV